ncbi:MAG: type II toxin-antitoxin system VapC family toxin [Pirellulales bacterium]
MYLLDTDHLGIIQRQTEPEFSRLLGRIGKHQPAEFFVPIVSFHEQVSGWNAYLQRARSIESVVRAYAMFQQILVDFARMAVVPFDTPAAREFDALRSAGVRVGTMDLRIAAIAISRQWTVLSRNLVDFQRVPGLQVEDWTM